MTTATVSGDIAERVLGVIPAARPGLSYQEIHERVGMWSLITIKHAIRQLKEEGLVVREGSHQKPEFLKRVQNIHEGTP